MAKFDIKTFGIGLLFSVIVVTILNLLLKQIFPNITVLKTGTSLILLMVGIALTLAFVFAADKKVTTQEVVMFFAILITIIAIYFLLKSATPEIFSLVPDATQEVLDPIITPFAILPVGEFRANEDCSFITNADPGTDGEQAADYADGGIWVLVDKNGDGEKESYKWIGTRGGSGGVCDGLNIITTTTEGIEIKHFISSTGFEQVYVCSRDGVWAQKFADTGLTQEMIDADSACQGNPTITPDRILITDLNLGVNTETDHLTINFAWTGGIAPYEFFIDWGEGNTPTRSNTNSVGMTSFHTYHNEGTWNGRVCVGDAINTLTDSCVDFTVNTEANTTSTGEVELLNDIDDPDSVVTTVGQPGEETTDTTEEDTTTVSDSGLDDNTLLWIIGGIIGFVLLIVILKK